MKTDGTDYKVIHEFQGGPDDGKNAIRVVISKGQALWCHAIRRTGGPNVRWERIGTLFRSNLDGSDYEIIHNFGHGPNNGTYPNNDLVVIGSTLYGSTLEGGEFEDLDPLMSEIGGGIVYSIPTDTNAVPEPSSSCVWFGLAAILVVVAHGTAKRRTVP